MVRTSNGTCGGMTEGLDRRHCQRQRDDRRLRPTGGTASVPICFVVDDEPSIRHFLSLVLHGAGLDTEEFADGASFRQAMDRRAPELVFLDIGLELRRGDRIRGGSRQARLFRIRAAHEHPRRRGARARQERRPAARAADAAGAQEAVRHVRDRRDHAAAQARPRRSAGGTDRARATRSRTDGSNSGTSRRSTCAESSSPASKRSRAAGIRNSASCSPPRSCRARPKPN